MAELPRQGSGPIENSAVFCELHTLAFVARDGSAHLGHFDGNQTRTSADRRVQVLHDR